jgi:predicted methyltransferase
LSTIDEILWYLKNGKWRSFTEIIEKSPLPKPITKMALNFLREYNFIQIDEKEGKAKLSPPMLNFIEEIQRIEKEETSSHKSFEGTVGINEFASFHRSFEKV